MMILFAAPFLLQGLAIVVDEFVFHHRRGLPKWERLGHPLDTLTVVACFLYLIFVPFSAAAAYGFLGLSIFSCAFITKDEWVHAEQCDPLEAWLHSVLFILHPIVLGAAGIAWFIAGRPEIADQVVQAMGIERFPADAMWSFLKIQTVIVMAFFIYQLIYWNFVWKHKSPSTTTSTKL